MDANLASVLETERRTYAMGTAIVKLVGNAKAIVVCRNRIEVTRMTAIIRRFRCKAAIRALNYEFCCGVFPLLGEARRLEWVCVCRPTWACVCRPTTPSEQFWSHFGNGAAHSRLKVLSFVWRRKGGQMTAKVCRWNPEQLPDGLVGTGKKRQ